MMGGGFGRHFWRQGTLLELLDAAGDGEGAGVEVVGWVEVRLGQDIGGGPSVRRTKGVLAKFARSRR